MSKKNDKLNEFRQYSKEGQLSIINTALLDAQENKKKLTVTGLSKIFGFDISSALKESFGNTIKFNGKINQYEIRENVQNMVKVLETNDRLTKDEISFIRKLYRNSNLIENLDDSRRGAKTCAFRMYPEDYELFKNYCKVNKLKVQDAIGIALREFCFKGK